MSPQADLWIAVRLMAEGSDWRRDQGETLTAWAQRKLRSAQLETAVTPLTRSRASLPANIRKAMEGSDLPVEQATAIADLCEGLMQPEAAHIDPEYARRNPLGGPAKVFDAMTARIRAGEDFYSVLDDYGFMIKPDESSPQEGQS